MNLDANIVQARSDYVNDAIQQFIVRLSDCMKSEIEDFLLFLVYSEKKEGGRS